LNCSSDGTSGDSAPASGIEDTATIRQKIIFDADVVKIFDIELWNFKHFVHPTAELGLVLSYSMKALMK
jgi:hypothetical protein